MGSAEARSLLGKFALGLLAVALTLPVTGSLGLKPESTTNADEIANEAILGFRGAIPGDVEDWLAGNGGQLLMRDDVLNFVTARFADRPNTDGAILKALARPDVKYAVHDGIIRALFTPNDPQYAGQWGFPAIKAPEAWDIEKGNHNVKVAILDTGLDLGHPDLQPNLCGPYASFVPSEGTIDDRNGHGTHVAGTVAAALNNGVGVAGTSQSCLMGAKLLGGGGSGQWSWAASAIRWAADNGAHIMSMSWGGGYADPSVASAMTYAYGKGILLVAAAGNAPCNGIIWPAQFPEAVAVAALGPPGNGPDWYSCSGPKMEIAAPGGGILSTYRGGGYATLSGTSMATPHVSGVAALAKAADPALTNVQMRCLLDLNADDLTPGTAGQPTRDESTGWGRVNAQKVVIQAQLIGLLHLEAVYELYCTLVRHPF